MNKEHKFYVLLGGDGVGKTTAMHKLDAPGWQKVAYYKPFVSEPYEAIDALATLSKQQAVPYFDTYSADLRCAYYHMFVQYMKDSVNEKLSQSSVLCDSYFYKFLAKESFGCTQPAVATLWRAYPLPDKVIFLTCNPEVAYERIVKSRTIAANECLDNREKEGFVRYQSQLLAKMKELVGSDRIIEIDVSELDEQEVVKRINQLLK